MVGGGWRPLPRHIVFQDGKERPIDDGKANSINRAAHMGETIVNQSGEFLALTIKAFLQSLAKARGWDAHALQVSWPTWLMFTAGLEDMWKGYRQNFATSADKVFCVITFVHPGTHKRVYAQCHGLPFGVASVVNQFNRMPMLLTAVCRRILLLMQGHYFDDNVTIELARIAPVSKTQFTRLGEYFGIVF